ncbi:MAG: LacI family DNA-binding transcriptional regulator [Arachnia sp.]
MSLGNGAAARRRRVTIVDVAKHAGVSTASASKVLRNAYGVSEAMRSRVQASMEELGYRPYGPARGMRGRTYTVGVVVSDIDNPFFSLLTDGLSSVIRPRSYELFVSPGGFQPETQRAVVEAMIDHQMDGLVLVAPLLSNAELERISLDIPLMVVGHHSHSDLFDSVAGDDELAAGMVVDHLVALGHRRIGFVMHGKGRNDESRPEMNRLLGFRNAMERHGLGDGAVVIDCEWSFQGGRDAVEQFDALGEPPTAVHAGADVVALGMMNELWRTGRSVPEVYSLVGHDNSRTSSLGPIRLTSVDQAGREMGERVGRLLLERFEGRDEARHEVLEPRLIVRDTTAAPPKKA